MRSGWVLLFFVVVLSTGGCCRMFGQSGTTSGVYGTVSDVTGAVVPERRSTLLTWLLGQSAV